MHLKNSHREHAAPPEGRRHGALAEVVERNIRSLLEVRRRFERHKRLQERLADAITAFTGSMAFVYIHGIAVGLWVAINLGWIPGLKPFDPYPFVLLAMIASV